MKFVIIIWAIMVLVGTMVWWIPYEERVADRFYEGKLVFETEQEYSNFKRAVGNSDVRIGNLVVLSSDPPIVVDFSVRVPEGMVFNYGKASRADFAIIPMMVAAFAIFIPSYILIVASGKD